MTPGPNGVQESAKPTKTAGPYSVTGPADPTGATGQTVDDGHLQLQEPAEDLGIWLQLESQGQSVHPTTNAYLGTFLNIRILNILLSFTVKL